MLMEAADQELSQALSGVWGSHQRVPWPALGIRSSSSYSSAAPLWSKHAIARREKSSDLEGKKPAQT